METVNLSQKFGLVRDYWSPKIVGELNDSYVKVVKRKGEFIWHHHEQEDELFLVLKGTLRMRFRDRDDEDEEGQMLIVPRSGEQFLGAAEEVRHVGVRRKSTQK